MGSNESHGNNDQKVGLHQDNEKKISKKCFFHRKKLKITGTSTFVRFH